MRPEPAHCAVGEGLLLVFPTAIRLPLRATNESAPAPAELLRQMERVPFPGKRDGVDQKGRSLDDLIGDVHLIGFGPIAYAVLHVSFGKAGAVIELAEPNDIALHLNRVERMRPHLGYERNEAEGAPEPDEATLSRERDLLPQHILVQRFLADDPELD